MSSIKVKIVRKTINITLSVLNEISVSAVVSPSNVKTKITASNSTII